MSRLSSIGNISDNLLFKYYSLKHMAMTRERILIFNVIKKPKYVLNSIKIRNNYIKTTQFLRMKTKKHNYDTNNST